MVKNKNKPDNYLSDFPNLFISSVFIISQETLKVQYKFKKYTKDNVNFDLSKLHHQQKFHKVDFDSLGIDLNELIDIEKLNHFEIPKEYYPTNNTKVRYVKNPEDWYSYLNKAIQYMEIAHEQSLGTRNVDNSIFLYHTLVTEYEVDPIITKHWEDNFDICNGDPNLIMMMFSSNLSMLCKNADEFYKNIKAGADVK